MKDKCETLSPNRRSRQREVTPVEEGRYKACFQPLNGVGELTGAEKAGLSAN